MPRWSNVNRTLLLSSLLLTAILFSPSVMAQEDVAAARNFDSFVGPVGSCDFGARMDNLAIELQNNPNADGYIIYYGPEGKSSGSGVFSLGVAKDYLVNTRGLDAERVKTIYGGRFKELNEVFTELWIVPHGAQPPEPVGFENTVKTFEGKFAEYEYWEGPDEGDGIPQGNVTLAGFADVLRQQPETLAYLVIQNTKEATPGAWRRAAKGVSVSLQDDYEIDPERIKIICAGYDADSKNDSGAAKVQLWVLPKNARPPALEVTEPEPRPEEAVRWRMFGVYELADASDKRDVFEAFTDVLRHDQDLSVCIIVHQRSAPQEITETKTGVVQQEMKPPTEAELIPNSEVKMPDVDLMKLAREWQSDLTKDYGISEQRMTIMAANSEEWSDGMLEIWIVPPGGVIPDPFKEDLIDADEAPQESPEAEPVERMQ